MEIEKTNNGFIVDIGKDWQKPNKYVFLTWSELVSWLEQNPLS